MKLLMRLLLGRDRKVSASRNSDFPNAAFLQQAFRQFVAAYAALLNGATDSGNPEIEAERRSFGELLAETSDPIIPQPPLLPAASKYIKVAHNVASDDRLLREMCAASAEIAHHAVWRNKYTSTSAHGQLFENFAFCDFIGPDGWQLSDKVTLGLVLLGPNTLYPFHKHPARELYFLLSGRSDWSTDKGPFSTREPGDWILHREMQPHAMRSGAKPMLAISAWRGDIQSRSRFIG